MLINKDPNIPLKPNITNPNFGWHKDPICLFRQSLNLISDIFLHPAYYQARDALDDRISSGQYHREGVKQEIENDRRKRNRRRRKLG